MVGRRLVTMGDLIAGRAAHICVDCQSMFAEETEWHAPWLGRVLPAIEAIVERRPERTVFTRFIPPASPEEAVGAWRGYYERWRSMTRERLPGEMIELVPSLKRFVPPAQVMDKAIYSPWLGSELHRHLRAGGIETVIVSGGETDVCVLATVLGAIDLGYRVVVPTDAIFGSADQTHDAVLFVYLSRFGEQLATCTTQDILDHWRELHDADRLPRIARAICAERTGAIGDRGGKGGLRLREILGSFPALERAAGQSGFAWAWLGAAMQATRFGFGMISAPGYRYHPAVLAQAAATIGEMFPDRLWLALGSGEAINEAVTGMAWPDKAERNAKLAECVAVTRALFAGETVTHRGRIEVVEARLYSLPKHPVPIFGAAVTPETAAFCGGWADGLLTPGGDVEQVGKVVRAFRENGGEGKPVHIQHALSWAPTGAAALEDALDQWSSAAAGGEVAWDLRRPRDFDQVCTLVGEEAIRKCVAVSADLGRHRGWIEDLSALKPAAIHLHNVGRNQRAFIEAFGRSVLGR